MMCPKGLMLECGRLSPYTFDLDLVGVHGAIPLRTGISAMLSISERGPTPSKRSLLKEPGSRHAGACMISGTVCWCGTMLSTKNRDCGSSCVVVEPCGRRLPFFALLASTICGASRGGQQVYYSYMAHHGTCTPEQLAACVCVCVCVCVCCFGLWLVLI